ncbi:helix-turn-helix domain-containing protein [Kitasatospora sp. P5_F3]
MPPAKKKPNPVTAAEHTEILRRHAAGETRNGIAREMHRSGQVISRIVAEAGHTFARSGEVVAATQARRIDLESRRVDLAHDLHRDAERLRAQLWQPHLYFDWGGKDHDYDERTMPEPTPADKRALMSTAGLALDRSLKLVPPTSDGGAEAARSMMGRLMTGLAEVYREQQLGDGEGGGDAP